ncbi:MAG TPA: hypothetical protein VG276_05510 [Actinomycetes bacterium]|nr:hypothetical protein [Actinomycetes bacterium]
MADPSGQAAGQALRDPGAGPEPPVLAKAVDAVAGWLDGLPGTRDRCPRGARKD